MKANQALSQRETGPSRLQVCISNTVLKLLDFLSFPTCNDELIKNFLLALIFGSATFIIHHGGGVSYLLRVLLDLVLGFLCSSKYCSEPFAQRCLGSCAVVYYQQAVCLVDSRNDMFR